MAEQAGSGAYSKRKSRTRRFTPLRRSLGVPVWADVSLRMGAAVGLIMFVVLVHWIDRAGLKDSYDGNISFLDVVYFTMISITTTGFGDIAPVTDRSRLIEAVIVTPIRLAVLFIFVGTAYKFVIKRDGKNGAWRASRKSSPTISSSWATASAAPRRSTN